MRLEIGAAAPGAPGLTLDQLYKLAETHITEGRLDEAEDILEGLLQRDPDNAYCLFGVASVQLKKEHPAICRQLLERCIELDDKMPEAWNNLGFLHHSVNKTERALECFQRAIDLRPETAEFWNNIATIYVNAGQPEKALERTARAIDLDPEQVDPHWNSALALLELGRWEEGFEKAEWGLKEEGKRKRRSYRDEDREVPVWDGTPGRNVVVYGEQGVGDEIMFASILPELQRDCASVIYDAHPRLMPLMRRSFPDITVYGTRKQTDLYWPKFHAIDASIAIGSLPRLYRKRDEDFPRTGYLTPDPVQVAAFRERFAELGDRPTIGISWKGGTTSTRHDLRSITLDQWLPIFQAIDANWVSLQYHDNAEYVLREFAKESGVEVHHWSDVIADLDRNYAGLMPALDLTISVCTSAVHAAGAYGLPCWCLCPSAPAWRYGLKGRMPWYDSVKMLRQRGRDWAPVIERAAKDLRRWADNRATRAA